MKILYNTNMKTIVLVGMPGAGKTTVGSSLSKFLNIDFVDIDSVIEKTENRTISEIFAQEGEKYFRVIESKTIKECFGDNKVISLGGGAFEDMQTRDFLLENSLVVYLKTSVQEIYKRVKNNSQRPLLNDNMSEEKINKILSAREKNYKLAHFTIITDNKHIEDVVRDILKCASLK